ncbi:energy transducer TonB [Rufibacter psychrotolerans]|uniref:energy transducer TonB n=1 Tax=Rufibacter psychrotolerans TaxID=2812556 RepID=UPI001967A5FE|nr:energy transducer TonB [Rufibacter sp. SYSU D00308]
MRHLYILILFISISIPSLAQKEQSSKAKIYIAVDEMPEFPGGVDSLFHYIKENFGPPRYQYTEDSLATLYLTFTVDYFGFVQDVELLSRVHPLVDENAVNLIKGMPQWKPGRHDGKTVNVKYTLPIRVPAPRSVPSFLLGKLAFSNFTYDEKAYETGVFLNIETAPKFLSGEKAFKSYIKKNYQVPEQALNQRINGTAKLSFIVSPDGQVTKIKALSDLGHGIEENLMEAIGKMPKWQPGMYKGQPQKVKRTVEFLVVKGKATFKEFTPSEYDNKNL